VRGMTRRLPLLFSILAATAATAAAQPKPAPDQVAAPPDDFDKQLDELFRKTLKAYAPGQDLAALRAEVSAQPLAGSDSGASLRLQLFLPGADGAPRPVDAVGPYQIFFSQLGVELGAPPAPPPEEPGKRREKRTLAPGISGV